MDKEIRDLIFGSAKNDVITTKEVTEMGIHRSKLKELMDEGKIEKYSRGLYTVSDKLQDDYFMLQSRYKQGIFSYGTALYLLGYSQRVPLSFYMTFPDKYNSLSLKYKNVIVKRVVGKNYKLGVIKVTTPYGNTVYSYNIERTLCDMFKNKEEDIQNLKYAMKKYVRSKNKNINKLIRYAKQLRVEKKVRSYLEVLEE